MDQLKAYERGAVDYVAVPVVPEILRAKVGIFVELYRKTPGVSPATAEPPPGATFIPFSAHTRMSGIDVAHGESIRKGAIDAVSKYLLGLGGTLPGNMQAQVAAVASQGATPLLVCEGNRVAGMVVLEDILKPNIRERFERLRKRTASPAVGGRAADRCDVLDSPSALPHIEQVKPNLAWRGGRCPDCDQRQKCDQTQPASRKPSGRQNP